MNADEILAVALTHTAERNTYVAPNYVGVCSADLTSPRSRVLLDLPVTETGKWIVYDIDRLNALTEAFVAGKFYVEMKTQIAPDADGRQGVLIYCPESDIEATAEAIRATGVTGTMFWKPDTATVRRIHGIDGIKYLAPGSDGIVRNPYYHHEASA